MIRERENKKEQITFLTLTFLLYIVVPICYRILLDVLC